MSERLFGTSGIRDITNREITPELAIHLAKSFFAELGEPGKVLIARDTRVSGEMLESALTSGFLSSGCEVVKLGVCPTPVLGFSIPELEADAGVMITASHNPPQYNGFKFFGPRGMVLQPERERKIENYYNKREFDPCAWSEIPDVKHSEVLRKYLELMSNEISIDGDYTVAIDCASGPSAKTTPQLLSSLGFEVITLNSQLDGTFPGRSPEPVEENLGDLSKMINGSDIDLGFAHDGDGDRIAVVDGMGEVVSQDKLLALMGAYSVERFGSGIVTTVDASKIVEEEVSEVGGEVSRTKVGDVSVAWEMLSQDFPFGGEPSGTWIIGDIHMCPDGTVAAARVLEMLDEKEKTLSQLAESISSYPILRGKVECPDQEKSEKMDSIEEEAPREFEGVRDIITVDGVRLEFEGGDWILIRPSGTEPYIRITSEAEEKENAQSRLERAMDLLKRS